MQNEKKHIILLRKAYQKVSQGAAIYSFFTINRETSVGPQAVDS